MDGRRKPPHHQRAPVLAPPAVVVTMRAELGSSRDGTPEPRLVITVTGGTFRDVHSAVYLMASHVENSTRPREAWHVRVDLDAGHVALELAHGTEAEAKRGMAVLETLVAIT